MPFFGMPARTYQSYVQDKEPRTGTLNAFSWLSNIAGYEVEEQMLRWIRKNVPPRTVVAEAHSASKGAYSYSGRVASLAGRPVPIGWNHHEGIWRGHVPEIGQNVQIATQLYRSATGEAILETAAKLDIRFIVIGKNEKEYVDRATLERFYQALIKVGTLVAQFPADKPVAFIFKLPEAKNSS